MTDLFAQQVALLQNLGVMAGLALAYSLVSRPLADRPAAVRGVLLGLLFGAAGALSMAIAIQLAPGLIFDVRGVPLILAGAFGGPWAAIVAGAFVGAVRVVIGGAGVAPAILGLIGMAGLSIGLGWLRGRTGRLQPLVLGAGGLVSMVPVFLGLTVLGLDKATAIVQAIGLPLTVTYTVGCAGVGFLLLLEDRRSEAEHQLVAARRAAEQANAAKSTFLAQISHELRTPMAAILGSLELLSTREIPDDQRQTLSVTRRAAGNLLGLLDDLLDLARVEAGRIALDPQPVGLDALLDDAVSLFAARAQPGVQVTARRDADVPPAVQADPKRLREILHNLMGNAVKFTDRGFVEATARRTEGTDGAPRLAIEVRDTGPGIPADRAEAIFDAFEQAEAGTARRYGGSGLGLAISRQLARAMGGDVTVSSSPGLGSCFSVDLPLVPAALEAAPGRPGQGGLRDLVARRPLAGAQVLLAEDIDANRTILAGMLETLGARVTAVADGRSAADAVARAGERPFDLVLMDMHMPVMDGMSAVRAIRALPGAAAGTAIVALTADATADHQETYRSSGLDDVLTKPVDWARLVAVADALGVGKAAATGAAPPAPDAPAPADLEPPRWNPADWEPPRWNPAVRGDLEATLGRTRLVDLLLDWPASIRTSLDALAAARGMPDGPDRAETLGRQAHALRGTAANYGFDRLAVLAQQVRENPAGAESLIDALCAEAQAAIADVDAYVAPSAPATAAR